MARKEISTAWDRNNRNNMNANFTELYNVQNRAIKEATKAVIEDSKLIWQQPVNTFADLATMYPDAITGYTVMTRDTGIVYRYNEGSWNEIQDIDPTVINEVDSRLSSQLTQTSQELESVENANAKQKLSFMNPYGNDENIHPKVLDFGTPWNGHRYWMAYTPFPLRNDKRENPCIAVATNVITEWRHKTLLDEAPVPLDIVHYNNDTHLVYREDIDTLECWWRYYNDVEKISRWFRRTTQDGSNWTAKELLLTSHNEEDTILSPSVIFEEGIYKSWHINGRDYSVYYQESPDGKDWTNKKKVLDRTSEIAWWHLDVIKTDLGYEFVIQGVPEGMPSAEWANLYYTKSSDNVTFDEPIMILKPSKRVGAFDNKGVYRSTILKDKEGTYTLIYSAFARNDRQGLGLSSGQDITKLVGSTTETSHLKDMGLIEFIYSFLKEGEWKISNGANAITIKPSAGDILKLLKANGIDIAGIEVSEVNVGYSYLKENELKLSNGASSTTLTTTSEGYLQFLDQNGKPRSVEVGGIKFKSDDSAAIGGEGAIRYNPSTKKHEASNGITWHPLY